MPAVHPSFSKRAAALIALSAALGITGCSGQSALLGSLQDDRGLRLTTIDEKPAAASAAAPAPRPRIEPVSDSKAANDIADLTDLRPSSAWCEYLIEDSAAEATVLRSPTLSGQVDDEGKGSINLGLSMSSFRKAGLTEEAAQARCRRHLAETGLQKIVFLAPLELTAAGYTYKAKAIRNRSADLAVMRKKIQAELNNGTISADVAARLAVTIDQLNAAANHAESEARRRARQDRVNPKGAALLGAELLQAESDLQDINSRMRTADAFDVSVAAGYADSDIGDGFERVPEGINGKVTFSVKLGAFAPQRYDHEKRAREARLRAVADGEGSALWQVRVLRESHLKALAGLEKSRRDLESAMAETRKLMQSLGSVDAPELAGSGMQAKLQLIQLEADKAGLDGSIGEIRSKIAELKSG